MANLLTSFKGNGAKTNQFRPKMNISGAPFKANRATEYSGNLFGSGGTLDVSVNEAWESPLERTW